MFVLKLRKIGASVGFILPEKMLEHLHAKEGQEVFAIETSSGYSLTTREPGVRKQVEAGEAFMDRYCDVFADLAKQKPPSDSR